MKKFFIGLIIGIFFAAGAWYALRAPHEERSLIERGSDSSIAPSTTPGGVPGYGPKTPPYVTPPTSNPPATGSTTSSDARPSGIRGSVVIGPTCPVERIPPDPACADRGFATRFAIKDSAGSVVKEFSSREDGTFSVALPAGTYTLDQVSESIYPRMISRDLTVIVKKGEFTSITIEFDSGIR